MTSTVSGNQMLHLVIGGELKDVSGAEFRDLANVDFVGAFPDYASAQAAWRGAAQRTVDSALTRYFIVPAWRVLGAATPAQAELADA